MVAKQWKRISCRVRVDKRITTRQYKEVCGVFSTSRRCLSMVKKINQQYLVSTGGKYEEIKDRGTKDKKEKKV